MDRGTWRATSLWSHKKSDTTEQLTHHIIIGSQMAMQNLKDFSSSESKKMKVEVAKSCLTLCDRMDYPVHGIL